MQEFKKNSWFWEYDFNNFKWRNEWYNKNRSLKRVTKTIKNETKEQRGAFLSMLLCTLGASLLENLLVGKGIVRAGSGRCFLNSPISCHPLSSAPHENKKGKGIVRAGSGRDSLNSSTSHYHSQSDF